MKLFSLVEPLPNMFPYLLKAFDPRGPLEPFKGLQWPEIVPRVVSKGLFKVHFKVLSRPF